MGRNQIDRFFSKCLVWLLLGIWGNWIHCGNKNRSLARSLPEQWNSASVSRHGTGRTGRRDTWAPGPSCTYLSVVHGVCVCCLFSFYFAFFLSVFQVVLFSPSFSFPLLPIPSAGFILSLSLSIYRPSCLFLEFKHFEVKKNEGKKRNRW